MSLFNMGSWIEPTLYVEGKTIYLRPFQMRDFEAWARLRGESRGFLTPWEPTWLDDDLTRPSFRTRVRRYGRDIDMDEAYTFAIFHSHHHALLGGITLGYIRRGVTQAGTLGYWIGAPHARQGYMSDALRACLRFGFQQLKLHRIEAACLPHNQASIRLLEKAGFEREGRARSYLKINGRWWDHILFGITENDHIIPHVKQNFPS
jgi:[ribosomal protein S5]-alanine N-acetyltransferase